MDIIPQCCKTVETCFHLQDVLIKLFDLYEEHNKAAIADVDAVLRHTVHYVSKYYKEAATPAKRLQKGKVVIVRHSMNSEKATAVFM